MKILAIGNSFSQDATRYIKEIANSAGKELKLVNLYIPGCSLERHAKNVLTHEDAYEYELNGFATGRMISVQDALQEEPWDIVTIQQASRGSGLPETYEPFASVLLHCVHFYAPDAKVYFHMTWAYELDSDNRFFPNYDCNQEKMYGMITGTTKWFTVKAGLDVIESGVLIQNLRQLPAFDYANGGLSLCRDGYHMTFDYGRYALGALWAEKLMGINVVETEFAPENTDLSLIKQIRKAAHVLVNGEA